MEVPFKVHTVGGSKRFSWLLSHGIALEAQWIPRSLIGKADLLRRFIDANDSPVNSYVSRVVEAQWGPRTNLNRFTSYYRAFSFRVLTPSFVVVAWFEPDLALYARFGTFVRHVSWLILRWGIQFQAWLVCSWMLTFHLQSWRYEVWLIVVAWVGFIEDWCFCYSKNLCMSHCIYLS